jgi:outer membrane protein
VNVSDAELGLVRAENDLQSALAELTAAMGSSSTQELELVEEPDPPPLAEPLEYLIAAALRERPDLASLRLQQQAAQSFARSERRLWLPTLSAMGSAGVLPGHEESLPGRYSAVGLNLSLPVLNGGLFSARKAEAEARAEAASQQVRDLELMIARDVKLARLNAETAFRRLQVTARLAEQAARSLKLAQARYDLGLGSIVELTQAQLNKTSAEIASANARYEYQLQRSVLDYQTGALK